MAKTKRAKATLKPVKSKKVLYNLNIGEMVRKAIEGHPTYTQFELSKIIGLGRQGMYHRLENPAYGSTYDLIEISILLKKDLISPMLEVIHNNGIYDTQKFSQEDIEKLTMELNLYKDLYDP